MNVSRLQSPVRGITGGFALMVAVVIAAISLNAAPAPKLVNPKPIFDGRTLAGWEGNPKLWRVQDGCLTGGSLTETVKENDFLCTTANYTNFILRLHIKLTGTEGFINSGIQIRSQRVPGSSESAGYQCDYGDPTWWGALYDEARRNRVLVPSDLPALEPYLHRNDWNEYVIRADGPRITLWLNGIQTVDYYEPESIIPGFGLFGIQVHGGGKALVQVKDVEIQELPPTKFDQKFISPPEPRALQRQSPLRPNEEQSTFTLPPDFSIELVASEEQGIGKPVTVTWDAQGRLWTVTATDYPVDGNDNPEIATALYQKPGHDKVMVIDHPEERGPHQPRVFADGLSIPLGVLPYKDGAFVPHGADILFLRDTNHDGKADTREVVLTGFGIGDSHLMPHQFTRAPGGWILVAQGAFNYSKVQTKQGDQVEFNRTVMGRFTPDGKTFEKIGHGPCNIWGLVMNREGEVFIQEANDYGYPMMPFHVFGSYPGCTDPFRPYAPYVPSTGRLPMGGTGLSGLAQSDAKGSFPGPYADVFYLANPVMQRVQAVKMSRDGAYHELLKLPDFVRSSDEWFRPVAVHFGPDGCLYIVDWYNKIISHNEVPRNHPERDKVRGRIWRVRHRNQPQIATLDFASLPSKQLLDHLGADSTWRSHMAWQQIVDRQATDLTPSLKKIALDRTVNPARRVQAFWALEGLHKLDRAIYRLFLADTDRNLRRESIRASAGSGMKDAELIALIEREINDSDPEVRAEVLRALGPIAGRSPMAMRLVAQFGQAPLAQPVHLSGRTGGPEKYRESYDRDFERFLVRFFLERVPASVKTFLAAKTSAKLPVENRLLAALSLDPKESAPVIATLLPQAGRAPGDEELLRLAEFPGEPGVSTALQSILRDPVSRRSAAEALIRVRNRLDSSKLRPLLTPAANEMFQADVASRETSIRLISAFQLKESEAQLATMLEGAPQDSTIIAVLRALRELASDRVEQFGRLAAQGKSDTVRQEAVLTLAAAPAKASAPVFWSLWKDLRPIDRRLALDRLAASREGASAMVQGAVENKFPKEELTGTQLERLLALLGNDPLVDKLLGMLGSSTSPTLRLDGKVGGYVETKLTLSGPFTVETWVKLDPGIDNGDGILGRPGGADFNFFDRKFRVYGGPAAGDRITAKRAMAPDVWTHIAVTRNDAGAFRIYLDGELDNDQSQPFTAPLTDLDIGRAGPNATTAGWLSEYRVWNRVRTPEEIRANFDRTYEGGALPEGLIRYFAAGGAWNNLKGGAKVLRTVDPAPVMSAKEAQEQEQKFAKYRALANRPGNPERGRALAATCKACHTIQGEGAAIGPNLSGAGAMGTETLLRSILTPSAAIEAGYRIYRIDMADGDILDGFLASEDAQAIVLRQPNAQDRRISKNDIRKSGFIRRSIMPEGLLEALKDDEVADLFTYLRSLK